MRIMIAAATLIAAVAVAVAIAVATNKTQTNSDKKQYCNDRFGFCIEYPSDYIAEPPPENGDGIKVHDSAGMSVTAYGSHNVFESTVGDEVLSDEGLLDKVTYRATGDNWLVISGIKSDKIVYKKTYIGGSEINSLFIEYPSSMSSTYRTAVEKISRSFKHGELGEPTPPPKHGIQIASSEEATEHDKNILGSIDEMASELQISRGNGDVFSATGVFAEKTFADGTLCSSIHYSGYCNSERASINFYFEWLSQEQKRLLHKLRGQTGCLTAEADKNGTVNAVAIHQGACR